MKKLSLRVMLLALLVPCCLCAQVKNSKSTQIVNNFSGYLKGLEETVKKNRLIKEQATIYSFKIDSLKKTPEGRNGQYSEVIDQLKTVVSEILDEWMVANQSVIHITDSIYASNDLYFVNQNIPKGDPDYQKNMGKYKEIRKTNYEYVQSMKNDITWAQVKKKNL